MPSLPKPDSSATALVTGASSGIGADLARELARRGYGVSLVARREDKLHALAGELHNSHGVRVEILECDLLDPTARDALPKRIAELDLRVDLLVHAAGFGQPGPFAEMNPTKQIEMTQIFCEASVSLVGAFVPSMKGRGEGSILLVSSSSGFQPTPNDAVYGACKAFQNSFADSLHAELRGSGISVTSLCPGPVKTEFTEVAGPHPAHENLPKFLFVPADQVAKAGIDGLAAGKRVVVPGRPMRGAVASGKLTPRGLQLRAYERYLK